MLNDTKGKCAANDIKNIRLIIKVKLIRVNKNDSSYFSAIFLEKMSDVLHKKVSDYILLS